MRKTSFFLLVLGAGMRNEWTDYFDDAILHRGNEYFRKGKVKGYSETADSCMARVLGTKVYNVRISGIKSGNLWLQCNCPYAKDGYECKHEAALLYYWQDQHAEASTALLANEKLKSDGMNTYFNIRKILESLDIEGSTLEKAHRLIKKNLAEVHDISLRYAGADLDKRNELVLIVDGTVLENRDYPYSVRVIIAKDHIFSKTCFASHGSSQRHYGIYNFNDYYDYYDSGICEHQMAMLLLADEYIAKYNPGDETDLIGTKILTGYKQLSSIKRIDETIDKGKLIRLQPRLSLSTSGNNLALRSLSLS